MLSNAGSATPLHAPWYVEGTFDVNVYYHGWPDDAESSTPTLMDSDSDADQSMDGLFAVFYSHRGICDRRSR